MSKGTSSSQRASGGVSSTGSPLDTLIVIPGDGEKHVLGIYISAGSNGIGNGVINAALFSRLVIAQGDISAYQASGNNMPTGFISLGQPADLGPNGLLTMAGRIIFDLDICFAPGQSAQYFTFQDAANEGYIGVEGGPISILLCAPTTAAGASPVGVLTKMNVQYSNVYSKAPADGTPGYAYTKRSGSPF